MKWFRISNLLNLVICRLHPLKGSNINFFVCTQAECFQLTTIQIKLGKRLTPNCKKKKKKKREMFTHPLDPYNDVDVPVFPFSKLRP